MQRCLELAKKGAGFVAPNPMVGAVLVFENRIIGEGWHQQYGAAHAEVNCIKDAMMHLNAESSRKHTIIEKSTLYVSLEPCAHYGKTPPCADLIIQHKIPTVFIGCRDPFDEVDGKGIEKLITSGVEVISGVLEDDCKSLNKRFFTFQEKKRPYVILKWAQTADGKIAAPLELRAQLSQNSVVPQGGTLDSDSGRLIISNDYSNRLVHQWRSEEASILVGTNTALLDDPELNTRLWEGNSPIRLVLDMNLRLPSNLKLFNKKIMTIVFNAIKQEENEGLVFFKIDRDKNIVTEILNALFKLNIQSVIVEGGAKLLQSFIDVGLWDEARVISNEEILINDACLPDRQGLSAPLLTQAIKVNEEKILTDRIEYYKKTNSD